MLRRMESEVRFWVIGATAAAAPPLFHFPAPAPAAYSNPKRCSVEWARSERWLSEGRLQRERLTKTEGLDQKTRGSSRMSAPRAGWRSVNSVRL